VELANLFSNISAFVRGLRWKAALQKGGANLEVKLAYETREKANVIDNCHYSIALGKEVTGNLEYNYERV